MTNQFIISTLQSMQSSLEGVELEAVIAALGRIEDLEQQLAAMKKAYGARFRRSSEKVDPAQITLDFVAHLAEEAEKRQDCEEVKESDGQNEAPRKQKRKKRKSGVKLLPVDKIDKPVPAEQRQCECGHKMETVRTRVERQIVYTPASLRMLEEHVEECACTYCSGNAAGESTPKPIVGGIVSSSLLAHLAVAKTIDATPIERIGRQFERHGALFAPSTLHDWFKEAGIQAGQLAAEFHRELMRSYICSLDDTRLTAKKDRETGTCNGRFWVYIGDVDRVAVCKYTPDWKGKHPREVLADYEGTIQLDGYAGLNPLFEKNGDLTRVGCNDHCRRFFVRALNEGDARAGPVVACYAELYAVEAEAKARGLDPCQLLVLRQQQAKPLWEKLGQAIENLRAETISRKSSLGRGLVYWDKQRKTLEVFLDDAYVPISNAHVERLIRLVALMRKNSLFVGTVEAGERYADLMTLMLNCVLCGANPYDYLCDLFTTFAKGWPTERNAELLPRAWLLANKSFEQPKART